MPFHLVSERLLRIVSYLLLRHVTALVALVILIGYFLLTSSNPTRNELLTRRSSPVLPVASTETRENSQHSQHGNGRLLQIQNNLITFFIYQLQDDLETFYMLLIELNVQLDIRRTILRDIVTAIFTTETTERAVKLVRLRIMVHSLDEDGYIQQEIDNLMTAYPVGMLQRQNITEEMLHYY